MKSITEVTKEILEERKYQHDQWPGDYDGRPFEEWLILLKVYVDEALVEYTHKPGPEAARKKVLKAANLALWALQCENGSD